MVIISYHMILYNNKQKEKQALNKFLIVFEDNKYYRKLTNNVNLIDLT